MGRIVMTLPDGLHDRLRADAASEGRTVNAQIRHLLAGGKPPRRKGGRKEKGSCAQIVGLLRTAGGEVSTREMAEWFGCHPDHPSLAWNLRDLLREGIVTRRYRRYLGYFYQLASDE
jgi:hypothetical protein